MTSNSEATEVGRRKKETDKPTLPAMRFSRRARTAGKGAVESM
jgi:hypothetical protein